MVKKIAFCFDAHLTSKQKPDKSYLLFKRYIKDFRPDELVIGGDFLDCEPLSHWIINKKRKVEGQRILADYEMANKELDYYEKYCKAIIYLEGNHEQWVEQYLDDHPEVEGILEVKKNLRLDERKIKYLPYNKLYKMGKLYGTHGTYTSKYHANKHLTSFGCNLVYGHKHQPQSDMLNMKMTEPYKAWAIGCLCGHEPNYMNNKPANWMNGFAIAYVGDGGRFNLYPVDIVKGQFISPDGKVYK